MHFRLLNISILLLALLPGIMTRSAAQPSSILEVNQILAKEQSEVNLLMTKEQVDTSEIARMLQIVGTIGKSYPDSGILILDHIRRVSTRTGYTRGIAKSLQMAGIIYSHSGRFEQGIGQLSQLIHYCLTTGKHPELLALGYNIIGNIYQTQGKYREAAYYYHQTLRLPKEHVKESTVALIYLNLSRLTHKLKQPRKALYYMDRAEDLAQKNGHYDLVCNINSYRGAIYTDMGLPDSAMYYLHTSTGLIRKYSHRYHDQLLDIEYANMVYLADLWLQQENIDSARYCINRIDEIQTFVVPQYRNKASLTTGRFYLHSGDYIKAEHYLLKALNNMEATHADNDLATVHLALSDLYDARGAHKVALYHNRNYIRLKDSLENEKITSNVHQLEVRYRTSEKDKELISQKLEISRQQNDAREKNLWIAVVTSGMILLVIISAALYKKRQANHRLQQKEIQLLKQQQQALVQEQEIKQLKAMMKGEEQERGRLARELHDGIGGMLTAITLNLGTTTRKHPELSGYPSLTELMHMLEDTSAEVRKTAHNLMPEVLVRHALPKALMIFCEHIHEELPTELSCEGDFSRLNKATELMLYRMVQELIQNILKHASATKAFVQLYIHDGKLRLTVEDNGTGFDTGREHYGFGLENLQHRIAALQGELSITSDRNRSTIIHIEFDLEKLIQINNPSN